MPNFYTQFSFEIPVSQAEANWLKETIENGRTEVFEKGGYHPDEWAAPTDKVEYDAERGMLWIAAEESGTPGALALVLEDFQLQFNRKDPIVFTWADTCSRPLCNQFSGGGVLIYRGQSYWATPDETLLRYCRELGIDAIPD